jgi:hypothetical protein
MDGSHFSQHSKPALREPFAISIRFCRNGLPWFGMTLFITVLIRILEAMFVIGGIGSFVVLILSGIEDVETLMSSEESSH